MICPSKQSERSSKKTALIAGAGVAGLSAAVFLDELGYRVTLVEKKPILGGRTYSFVDKKTGHTIDNGQHLLIGAYHETLGFLERIGAKSQVVVMRPTIVPLIGTDGSCAKFKLNGSPPPCNVARAFLGFRGFSVRDKWRLIALARELGRIKRGTRPYPHDQTVNDWLKSLGQSPTALENFWKILALATLNDSPAVTSAGGLAQVLIRGFLSGRGDGYLIFPKVGLSELFVKPTRDYLALRGHYVIQGVGLRKIKITNNMVTGFSFADGTELTADLFISALPFRPLTQVLPPSFLDNHPQLKHIKDFTASPIVSINLFFDRPVMTAAFMGSAATTVHWFFSKTGGHIMGVISGAYDFLNKDKEEIVGLALADIKRICPAARQAKLIHALVNKQREATLSSRPGINTRRPDQKILGNFYIIGDWTQTHLPATIESAVVSSKMMAEDLSRLIP